MVGEWALIVFIYAGGFSGSDSVAVSSVYLESETACAAAKKKLMYITRNTKKDIRMECVATR